MNLFDDKQRLRKYDTIDDIVSVYYPIRLDGYNLRKEYQLKELQRRIVLLSNRAKFIKEQCDNTIDLRKKKKSDVIKLLFDRNYAMIDNDEEYKYLRSMTFDQLEEENIEKMLNECQQRQNEFDTLSSKAIEELWMSDLKDFDKEYEKYKSARKARLLGEKVKKRKSKKSKK